MDKKEQILTAAIKVVSELGFDQATAKDIAVEAGVSVGTLYNHFRDKDDILNSIFAHALESRLQKLQKVNEMHGGVSGKLRSFLHTHFTAVRENPHLHQLLIQESQRPPYRRLAAIRDYSSRVPEAIEALLINAAQAGELRATNTRTTAAMLFSCIHGLTTYLLEMGLNEDNCAELEEVALEMLLHGLLKNEQGE